MRFRLALNTPAAASGTRSTRASRSPSTRNPFAKRALRRNADAHPAGRRPGSSRVCPPRLACRRADLSARGAGAIARSLRGVVRGLDGNALPGAVPLNRRGVRRTRPRSPLSRSASATCRARWHRGGCCSSTTSSQAETARSTRGRTWIELPGDCGRSCRSRRGWRLMFDLAAIGIAVACFVFLFALLWALERV